MNRPTLTVHRGGEKGGKPRKVWTCTECGREGFWGPGWSWHGSLSDEDEGTIRTIVCSEDCRAATRQHRSDR